MTRNFGPVDSSTTPRFAGSATLARLPHLDQVERAEYTHGTPFRRTAVGWA